MTNKKHRRPSKNGLRKQRQDPVASKVGMFLLHNGVVRQTPKAKVRQGLDDGSQVIGLEFSYDPVQS